MSFKKETTTAFPFVWFTAVLSPIHPNSPKCNNRATGQSSVNNGFSIVTIRIDYWPRNPTHWHRTMSWIRRTTRQKRRRRAQVKRRHRLKNTKHLWRRNRSRVCGASMPRVIDFACHFSRRKLRERKARRSAGLFPRHALLRLLWRLRRQDTDGYYSGHSGVWRCRGKTNRCQREIYDHQADVECRFWESSRPSLNVTIIIRVLLIRRFSRLIRRSSLSVLIGCRIVTMRIPSHLSNPI